MSPEVEVRELGKRLGMFVFGSNDRWRVFIPQSSVCVGPPRYEGTFEQVREWLQAR